MSLFRETVIKNLCMEARKKKVEEIERHRKSNLSFQLHKLNCSKFKVLEHLTFPQLWYTVFCLRRVFLTQLNTVIWSQCFASILLALQSLCVVDAIAVDGKWKCGESPSAVVKTLAAGICVRLPPLTAPPKGVDMLSRCTWWYSISMGVLGSMPKPGPSTKFIVVWALGRRLLCMARLTSAGAYRMVPVV